MEWTQNELNFLIQNYNKLYARTIAEKLNRTECSVLKKIHNLFPNYRVANIWEDSDIEFLKNNYQIHGNAFLKKHLHKNIEDIKAKMQELNLTGVRNDTDFDDFSDDEKEFITNHYLKMNDFELAMSINELRRKNNQPQTCEKTIYRLRAKVLNLKRPRGGNDSYVNKWTEDEDRYLIDNFYYHGVEAIGKHLNRTPSGIQCRALKLGLVKAPGKWFTKEKKEFLRNNINTLTINELVDKLEIPAYRIVAQASAMKLLHEIKPMTLPEQIVKQELDTMKINYEMHKTIYLTQKTYCIVDFLINKNVLEIQGLYYHGSPKYYDKNDLNWRQQKQILADKRKRKSLEKIGYQVIYFWEDDVINNIEKIRDILATLSSDRH